MSESQSMDEQEEVEGFGAAERYAAMSRSTWVSMAVNGGLSLMQFAAGVLAHSQGLIADGVHSLSDVVADIVVLLAGQQSKKDADHDHPYGHHRFETGASLALGALLLLVGVGLLWSAIQKIQAPQDIPRVHWPALWVAAVVLICKEALFRYLLRVAVGVKSSLLVANAWHARSDAASSLVVGLGVLGNLLGYTILDPIAALMVALWIGKMGWKFGWNALHDLMDRAVDDSEVDAIRDTLLSTPGVLGVHDVRTRKMGDMIVVDAHLEVKATLTVEQGHDIAVSARQRVMQRHRVLDLMAHVDPSQRPDLDHRPVVAGGPN